MKNLYKGIMAEINEEVSEGVLSLKDTIQVLRAEKPIFENYRPIEDWYYDVFLMQEEMDTPLEEMYLPEEFSAKEWDDMKKEQEAYIQQYKGCKDKLVNMTVKDALTEMKQIQKLLK